MDSNTEEQSSQSSTCSIDEDIQRSYQSRMESAQNFDNEESLIVINVSSDSEKSNVENKPDTQPLSSDSDGNKNNLNKYQKFFASYK